MSTETLSHDMRAPLASIVMIVSLLIKSLSKNNKFGKERQKNLLVQIKSQANLLMNFAHDLLDVRQITLDKFTRNMDKFDPNLVFKKACEVFDQEASMRKIDLSFNVFNFLMAPLSSDSDCLIFSARSNIMNSRYDK